MHGGSPSVLSNGLRSNSSGPDNLALKLRRRCHGIGDRSVLANVLVQQIETPIVFIRVDDEVIGDRGHEGRTVLTNSMKADFDAAEPKWIIGATRSMPLIMQAAMAARNSSAGLKASGRPFMSVSRVTSASLQRARLPCASTRFATTSYSSMRRLNETCGRARLHVRSITDVYSDSRVVCLANCAELKAAPRISGISSSARSLAHFSRYADLGSRKVKEAQAIRCWVRTAWDTGSRNVMSQQIRSIAAEPVRQAVIPPN